MLQSAGQGEQCTSVVVVVVVVVVVMILVVVVVVVMMILVMASRQRWNIFMLMNGALLQLAGQGEQWSSVMMMVMMMMMMMGTRERIEGTARCYTLLDKVSNALV